MRVKRYLLLVGVIIMFVLGHHALAADPTFGLKPAADAAQLSTNGTLVGTIGSLIKTALSLVGILFLILMIYAGFIYMTARGDEKKVGEAKSMIIGAVIGIVIIAAAYAVTSFVITTVTNGSNSPSNSAPNTPPPSSSGTVDEGGSCTNNSQCLPGLLCESNGKCG